MAVIMDWHHCLHRNVGMKKAQVIENYNMVAHMMLSMVASEINKFGASLKNPLIIATDSKPYWRSKYYDDHKQDFPEYYDSKKEAWKTYKGNRTKDPDINWKEVTRVSNFVLKTLDLFTDVNVINIPTAEADDIIYVTSKYYNDNGQPVIIVTSDKDMVQCQISGKIEIYDPIKQLYVPETDKERFVKMHLMMGDKGDNILAIKPKLGPETAKKLYDTLEATLLTNPDMKNRYEFNRVMIDFRHIPPDLQQQIVARVQEPHINYHAMNFLKCLRRIECREIANNIQRFKFTEHESKTILNAILQPTTKDFNDRILSKFFED